MDGDGDKCAQKYTNLEDKCGCQRPRPCMDNSPIETTSYHETEYSTLEKVNNVDSWNQLKF